MIKKEVEINLTPKDLSNEFWNMCDDEQSKFFNELGKIFYEESSKGVRQLDFITDNNYLNEKGIWFIKELYERIVYNENN